MLGREAQGREGDVSTVWRVRLTNAIGTSVGGGGVKLLLAFAAERVGLGRNWRRRAGGGRGDRLGRQR